MSDKAPVRKARQTAKAATAASPSDPTTSNFAEMFKSVYAEQFTPLASWLHAAFGAGPPEPEDVAQRAFANLARRGDLSDIENPKAFLWRTARNIMVSQKRHEATRNNATEEMETIFSLDQGDVLNPERVLEAKDALAAMVKAVEKMPTQRRRAFQLKCFEGLNNTEIGKRLGISRPAIHKHLVRAGVDITKAYRAYTGPKTVDEDGKT